jgi:NDP-sugar pyrophosphorylase family protein
MMQAVILAAGEGKRLRPLTKNRPKALIPIANKPIVNYPIRSLLDCGIRDIIVVVGYRKEHVIRHINRCDAPIEVVVQKTQLGTGDALRCATPLVREDFLVLPGDNFIDAPSISRIMAVQNSVLVKEHPYPSNFGVVMVDRDGVSRIIEKPEHAPSFTVSTGIYHLTPDFLPYLTENSLTDSINGMLAGGGHLGVVMAGEWHDAVYPWDLLALNRKVLRDISPEKSGSIDRTAVIRGPVRIGKGATIGPFTVITGPVIIGDNAEIGSHGSIGPFVSIGDRGRIGPFTLIDRALLMDDAAIGSHSRVTEAIIGEGSSFSDHTTVEPGVPIVEIEGILMRGRFGCVVGDRVRADPFCIFQGALVGNDVRIRGGKMISGLDAFQDGVMVV